MGAADVTRVRTAAGWIPGDATDGRAQLTSTLLALAAVSVSAIAAVLVLTASGTVDQRGGRLALHLLIVGAPVVTGLYAARFEESRRFGRLLMLAGFVWSLAVLAEAPGSFVYSIGRIAAWTIFPLLTYLLLSFPNGRLDGRRDRVLVVTMVVLIATLYIGSAPISEAYPEHSPWASCDDRCPANAFFVLDAEPGFVGAVLEPVRDTLSVLLLGAVVVALAARLRAATGVRRVMTAPVFAVGAVATLVLLAFVAARRMVPESELPGALGLAWVLCLPAIAAAFSIGLLQRKLLLGGVLTRLSLALRGSPGASQVARAVGDAIGARGAEVAVRDGFDGAWRDERGRPAAPAQLARDGKVVRRIRDSDGDRVAIAVDAELAHDELVDAIVSVSEAALRQASLRAELDLSLRDLDESRKRIATAADLERRRIERDLHDGAQQRLIALRMRLSLAEDLLVDDPDAAAEAIHVLGDQVDDALGEIRALAHGIYPALLADRGLADALRSVARVAPLNVEIRAVGLTRQPPEIESAVYYTCVEALQNALKHAAGATRATVSLRQQHDLEAWIVDDGEGFDVAHTPAGGGLRNMHDRIESVGGSLEVVSSREHGTAVRAAVPLHRRRA